MENRSHTENQIQYVTNFQDFVSTSFHGKINAICWNRKLVGDFSEIVDQLKGKEYLENIDEEELNRLNLSEQGKLARHRLLEDFNLNNQTIMVAPAAGFYSTKGIGTNQVRIAYVLKKENLINSVAILKAALNKYNSL